MPKQPPFDVGNSFKTTLFKFKLKCKPFVFTAVLPVECDVKVRLLNFKDETYNLRTIGQFLVRIYELQNLKRFL